MVSEYQTMLCVQLGHFTSGRTRGEDGAGLGCFTSEEGTVYETYMVIDAKYLSN